MVLKHSLIALVFALPGFAQQPLYAQCGGIGWTGGTTATTVPPTTVPPTTTPTTTPTNPPTTVNPGEPAPTGCPAVNAALVANAKLPDPFTFTSGARVTTKADWACRRAEISQLFQRYELGTLPPRPSGLTSTLSGNMLSITATEAGKSISFSASISKPTGTGPFPAIIAIGGMSIPTPAGVAVITFNNNDLAAQNSGSSRGQGKFYTLYGSGHSASAMMAWAWGVNRIVDALEQNPSSGINLQRLGVTGCSRNGKGTLVAGAFEPRIALTIPQESGSGGAGCWRISDAMLKSGINTQTASQIVGENVWFSTTFATYANQVNNLPFDHHLLSALIAPRGLLIIEHSGTDWLGPQSTWGCQKTANKVWQALGAADSMGVSSIGNHNHCAFPSSQQGDLDAFVNRFLKGQSTNTNVMRTDGANNLGFVESSWVSWAVPTLA